MKHYFDTFKQAAEFAKFYAKADSTTISIQRDERGIFIEDDLFADDYNCDPIPQSDQVIRTWFADDWQEKPLPHVQKYQAGKVKTVPFTRHSDFCRTCTRHFSVCECSV